MALVVVNVLYKNFLTLIICEDSLRADEGVKHGDMPFDSKASKTLTYIMLHCSQPLNSLLENVTTFVSSV